MEQFTAILSNITWRPGFNDNNFSGWLVTAGYVVAVMGCFLVARRTRQNQGGTPRLSRIWTTLGMLLLLLGANQQLDLQTLMIEAGRELASVQGWFEHRRLVQKIFFGAFAVALTAFGIVLAIQWRGFLMKNRWVTIGLVVLLGFILMRAASINHLQADSPDAASEESWEDYVELIGLLLITGGIGDSSRWTVDRGR